VYLENSPYDNYAAVGAFEALLKHKMAYVLWFQSWGDDPEFRSDWVLLAAQKGLIPVITWEPWKRDFVTPWVVQPEYALETITAGQHDDYLRSWARAAKAAGVPIVLRFAHEQSTRIGARPWYPWQGDPESYRDAFRHIVAIFRQEEADNVRFLWSAMWLQLYAEAYYPGDDVVDIVGTTILNHGLGATADWAGWRTFDYLFSPEYIVAEKLGKPVMITEMATAEQGGDKPAWLRDAFSSIRTRYTLVEAVLLLEMPVDREWPVINWSVASSPASLAAFEEAIADPTFK
jgi:beta-mannanase